MAVGDGRSSLFVGAVPSRAGQPKSAPSISPGADVVHLLLGEVADVADPEVPGLAVERVAPRVPQAERDHLGLAGPRVEPQQLAEQAAGILRAARDREDRAALPGSEVELAVGAERSRPPQWIGLGCGIESSSRRERGSASPDSASQSKRSTTSRPGAEYETKTLRAVRRERDREQAALALRLDVIGEVEDGLRADRAVGRDRADGPAPLGDVERAVAGRRLGQEDRLAEFADAPRARARARRRGLGASSSPPPQPMARASALATASAPWKPQGALPSGSGGFDSPFQPGTSRLPVSCSSWRSALITAPARIASEIR